MESTIQAAKATPAAHRCRCAVPGAATYDRTAESFGNPDHVDIVIPNYRVLALGEAQYDDLEKKLNASLLISVATITIASDYDGTGADERCLNVRTICGHLLIDDRHYGAIP